MYDEQNNLGEFNLDTGHKVESNNGYIEWQAPASPEDMAHYRNNMKRDLNKRNEIELLRGFKMEVTN